MKRRFITFFLFVITACTIGSPLAFAQSSETPLTPNFYPLAPCPTCTSPSVAPVNGNANTPSGAVAYPTAVKATVQTTAAPVVSPCDASIASDTAKSGKHKKHTGSISTMMQAFLHFFIELINKLLAMLRGGQSPVSTPTTEPTTIPSTPAPTAPCTQVPTPTTAPSISTVPTTAPVILPSTIQTNPSSQPLPSITDGSINFRADLETGNSSQFTALECANPNRQFQIVTTPVRQGKYAARFETTASDVWGNGSVRCLAANYNTGEAEGQDNYYGFSMYFPQKISYNLLWELHHGQHIYKYGALSVAPFAIEAGGNGNLTFRIGTGKANWSGSGWTGWSHWEPQIPLMSAYPTNTWIDFIVHIKFTESDTGIVEVWHREGSNPWPATPQISRPNIPTLPWIPGGLDPGVPTTVHAGTLYLEMGLYGTPSTNVMFHDGFRRGTSKEAVMAEFP